MLLTLSVDLCGSFHGLHSMCPWAQMWQEYLISFSDRSSSVYSIQGRKNFYVSPMKESPFKSPHSPGNMTPRTRQLYNFGEGPGVSLLASGCTAQLYYFF